MKRVTSLLLAVALLVPLLAHAAWVTEPLGWRLVNQGAPFNSTGIFVRDTTFSPLAAGRLDTTATFSPKGKPFIAGPQTPRVGGSGDSLLVGYLLFVQDTASTTDPTFSTVTIAIDGRVGGFGTNLETDQWTAIDTISVGATVGQGSVAVPVRCFGAFGKPLTAYPELRARNTAGVGILFSARAFFRYWRD